MKIKTNEILFTKRKRDIKTKSVYSEYRKTIGKYYARYREKKQEKQRRENCEKKPYLSEFNEEKSDFECFISFRKIQVLRKDKA